MLVLAFVCFGVFVVSYVRLIAFVFVACHFMLMGILWHVVVHGLGIFEKINLTYSYLGARHVLQAILERNLNVLVCLWYFSRV